MRKARLVLIVALLLLLTAVLLAPRVVAQARAARNRAWAEDVAFLAEELEKRHYDLFRWTDREAFERAVAELTASIPAMTADEIKVGLARILAMAHDGHTGLLLWDGAASGGCGFRRYLITAYWFPEGLYVTGVCQGLEDVYGCRIARIGDKDVGEALALVQEVIPYENDQWLKELSPYFLLTPEILGALGIVRNPEAAAFTFERPSGSRFTMVLVPATPSSATRLRADPGGEPPLYRSRPGVPNWLTYLEDSQTLYFYHGTCTDITSLVVEMRRVLDAEVVDKVVVDLRDNAGGPPSRFLANTLKRRSLSGRLFCIIGRRTFSGGIITALWLKRVGAVLVGEPTGGRTSPIGGASSFCLPHSGLLVFYTDTPIGYSQLSEPALTPDIPVAVTAAEYYAGRDPVLEMILTLDPGG